MARRFIRDARAWLAAQLRGLSLAQKLVLYALAVALVPLAATGFSLVEIGETALRQRIQEHQETAAVALAEKVSLAVEDLARRLSGVTELTDVLALTPAEREGLARMLYRQSIETSMVLLLDTTGQPLASPIFVGPDAQVGRELVGHPRASLSDVGRVLEHLPALATALAQRAGDVLLSPVYFPPDGAARITVAVPCSFDSNAKPRALAVVELALRDSILRVEGIDTGVNSRIFVVDRVGRVILHPREPVGADLRERGAVRAYLTAPGIGIARYSDNNAAQVAAFAPVGALGWAVVVEQPAADAFAAAQRMRTRTLAWLCGTTAVVLLTGLAFAGALRRSLTALVDGARAFGEGKLTQEISVASDDEIGELAATMNGMARALNRSLRDLQEWSHTLEARVAERTRDLEAAQAQLVMQAELAAIGQLGAGVAHEVNNPLAALLGQVQLLLLQRKPDHADWASLKQIEEAAVRCRAITLNLLRFSQRGALGRQECDLNEVVREVVTLAEPGMRTAGVTLRAVLADGLPSIVMDAGQISLVLTNILNNARNASSASAEVVIETRLAPEGVAISVRDKGRGIAAEHLRRIFEPFFTTKQVWAGVGLGLSVAYRIVTDHGGRIDVQSAVGEGSEFVVVLPRVGPPVMPDPNQTRKPATAALG